MSWSVILDDEYGATFYTGLGEIVHRKGSGVYHLGSKAWEFPRSRYRFTFATLCGTPYRHDPPWESYSATRNMTVCTEPPKNTRLCRGCARSNYLHGGLHA